MYVITLHFSLTSVDGLEVHLVPATHLWLGINTLCNETSHRLLGSDRLLPLIEATCNSLGNVLFITGRRQGKSTQSGVTEITTTTSDGHRSLEINSESGETDLVRERLLQAWVSESEGEGTMQQPRECLPGLKKLPEQMVTVDQHTHPADLETADQELRRVHVTPPGAPLLAPAPELKRRDDKMTDVVTVVSGSEKLLEEIEAVGSKSVDTMSVEHDSCFNSTVDSAVFSDFQSTQSLSPWTEVQKDEGEEEEEEEEQGSNMWKGEEGESPWIGVKEGEMWKGEEGKEEVEEGVDEGIGMEDVIVESGDSGEGGSVIVVGSDYSDDFGMKYKNVGGSDMEQRRVVHCCGMELSHSDLSTLSPNQCLNDQVCVCTIPTSLHVIRKTSLCLSLHDVFLCFTHTDVEDP